MSVRFSGGDHLSANDGLKFYIHKTMMLNELNNGEGAYEISNAELASSGPSFGPIQYDLGSNTRGQTLFESIAGSATNAKGERIVSDAELSEIRDNLYRPFNEMTQEQRELYTRLKPKIDLALGSPEGIRQINADYDNVLDTKVNYVNGVIAGVTHPENKAYLESDLKSQVQIADIRNQYGDAVNNSLRDFLNQSAEDNGVQIPKGGNLVKVTGAFDHDDIEAFRMGTAYGKAHPSDAQRRENNIDSVTRGAVLGASMPVGPEAQSGTRLADAASLSPDSRQLVLDSEQHMRALADRLGLPWDQGMENTVLSVAQQARENGLTSISHFKLSDGQIRFAQQTDGVLREGAVDARSAANTDAAESFTRLREPGQGRLSGAEGIEVGSKALAEPVAMVR